MDPMKRLLLEVSCECFEYGRSRYFLVDSELSLTLLPVSWHSNRVAHEHSNGLLCWVYD
jgi:hypothetical protein